MADEKNDNTQEGISVPAQAFAKSAEQKRIRTERYRRIYANNLHIEFSSWDMSITFGEILEGLGDEHIIEEIVHITMSHEFGKTVAAILAANIKGFEKQFGPIRIPVMREDQKELEISIPEEK